VAILVLSALPAAAGGVGVLDAQRAVQEVEQGKAKFEELDAWAAPRQQQIEAMRTELVEVNNQFTQQRAVATQEVLADLQSRLRDLNRNLEDATRNFNRDAEAKQRELLDEVAVQVGKVASEYAEERDFDVVLIFDAQPLVYMSQRADITDKVIELYNQKYPVN
jgi:outer membrane protein